MTKQLTTTEKRFRDGSGVRFLDNGEVRCQAQSKAQLRKWREVNDDFTTPAENIWPECQCPLGAIPGMFTCHFHGGRTPSKNKPKSIFDVIPLDLGEKLKVLMEHPDYISRREDMLLIKARQWEILEEMQASVGGEEAWGMVSEAVVEIRKGNEVAGLSLLEDALQQSRSKAEAWKEWERSEELLKDLTNTEVKSAKELKLMASADQVAMFINNIYGVIMRGAEKYIDNPLQQSQFIQYIAGEIGRFANVSPAAISFQLGSGRDSENSNAR